MTETAITPTIRVRINHDRTSAGWRLKETTVEIMRPINPLPSTAEHYRALMEAEMYAAHQSGLEESERRNAQEHRS